MRQEAIIVAMVGSSTSKQTSDPVDILNSVCHEGSELEANRRDVTKPWEHVPEAPAEAAVA